ncbi:lyase family protein [Candidatus Bathyarchaeota archaeon]|nr:lyase family protein [Candidatus Bathyarchaeota archaeon]
MTEKKVSSYSLFSPTDYRYGVKALEPYLSEEAYVRYKAKVEIALVQVLAKRGLCSNKIAEEIAQAAREVTANEVYAEEERIKHDVRALVNVIRSRVSEEAKPYVHATATSYDIVDTANALRYKDSVSNVIIPDMVSFEKALIEMASEEKETIQIGRTHGQHAEPITFGFAIAQYISRWGNRILKLKEAANHLIGKFSGAVGAYNASSLFFSDPEAFEADVLNMLDLKPGEISTQIIQAEPTADFFHSIVSSFGVLANYARDMRNLQRTEIGEVGETYGVDQVGSSTMPQKRNPINFENVESAWKKTVPQMVTVYLDQISEHQRDLTNSLSQRYLPELLVVFDSSVRKMTRITHELRVDKEAMRHNLGMSEDKIIAEPLYILLAYNGHSDAHEYVRRLTDLSYRTGKPLNKVALEDSGLKPYLRKFTQQQLEILNDPSKYLGRSAEKTEKVVEKWKHLLKELE